MARGAANKINEAVEKEQRDIANIANDIKDYVNGTTGEKTLVQMFEDGELQVGDYLNYKNPVYENTDEGRYTAKADKTGMTRANEDGEEELNNIEKIFRNEKYVQKVRSVTMEDINEAVVIKTEEDIKKSKFGYYPEYGSIKYGGPYSFGNQHTSESWLNNKQQITVTGIVNGYYYSINDTEEPTVKVNNKTLSDMLFDNVEWDDEYGVTGANYWLASRGVCAYSGYAVFGIGSVFTDEGFAYAGTCFMFSSDDGGEYCDGFAVRPVVILKSDLTAKDLQKINQIEEERWTYGKPTPTRPAEPQ